jgi:hypothetical protein
LQGYPIPFSSHRRNALGEFRLLPFPIDLARQLARRAARKNYREKIPRISGLNAHPSLWGCVQGSPGRPSGCAVRFGNRRLPRSQSVNLRMKVSTQRNIYRVRVVSLHPRHVVDEICHSRRACWPCQFPSNNILRLAPRSLGTEIPRPRPRRRRWHRDRTQDGASSIGSHRQRILREAPGSEATMIEP